MRAAQSIRMQLDVGRSDWGRSENALVLLVGSVKNRSSIHVPLRPCHIYLPKLPLADNSDTVNISVCEIQSHRLMRVMRTLNPTKPTWG